MAERTAVKESIKGGEALAMTWTGLATNDTGNPQTLTVHGDISLQVLGTFGGATIVWQGSNDGTTWVTLIDMQGSNLSHTAAAFKTLRDVPRYIRPSVTGGTGVNLTAILFARRKA